MEEHRFDVDTAGTGRRIKEIRKSKKMPVYKLARLLGTKEGTIYKWERGQSVPRIDNLISLCSILDVSPSDICVFYKAENAEKFREICRR